MSGMFDDGNRQVIPRWLSYKTSCSLGLLNDAYTYAPILSSFSPNPSICQDWESHPNIITAGEFVSEALFLGNNRNSRAIEAANYILKNASHDSLLIRELADTFLNNELDSHASFSPADINNYDRTCISILKHSVRTSPINPVAWSDLSLCYAMHGNLNRAKRAMTVAISLAPYNRFILRNAARFYLHIHDNERALNILRRSGLCVSDPWIASAEIAISEGLKMHSACLKQAKGIVSNDNLSHFARSEIAATLSTIEAKAGSRNKAKRLIKQTLEDPSENALAQIEWLALQLNMQAPENIIRPASFEAQTRHLLRNKRFSYSIDAAEKWIRYQPFSARPLVFATFLASVCLDDDRRAIQLADNAAPAAKHDPLILNNMAFAYARQNNINAATNHLSQIKASDVSQREALCIMATHGLIHFRSNNDIDGRELYRKSIIGYEALSDYRSAAIAAYFWACEEKRISSSESPIRIADAKRRIRNTSVFELEDAAEKL